MKLVIIFIFVISFMSRTQAQDYFLGMNKESILGELNSIDKHGNFEVFVFPKDLNTTNLEPMTVELKSVKQNFIIDFLFDKNQDICVAIILKYHCGECVDKQVKDLLEDKKLKWKALGKSEYISRKIKTKSYKYDANHKKVKVVASPHMKIVKDIDNEFCAFVRLSLPFYTPEEWKALTE